jgi:hypothetical protein
MTESVRRPSLAGHLFLKGSFRDVGISFRILAIARADRAPGSPRPRSSAAEWVGTLKGLKHDVESLKLEDRAASRGS